MTSTTQCSWCEQSSSASQTLSDGFKHYACDDHVSNLDAYRAADTWEQRIAEGRKRVEQLQTDLTNGMNEIEACKRNGFHTERSLSNAVIATIIAARKVGA